MKRILSILLICIFVLCGCAPKKNDELNTMRDQIDEVGIAFLGYVSEKANETELRSAMANCAFINKYDFLKEAPIVSGEGQELYILIPKNEDEIIELYHSSIDENANEVVEKEAFYKSKKGEAIIVRCNLSELYSNIVVQVGDYSFSPYISLKDGHVGPMEGLTDLSIYE